MTVSTVWTIVVERNRIQQTHFGRPWESPQGFEAYKMFGPADHPTAWEAAKKYLENHLEKSDTEYSVVGIVKGDFAEQFYFLPSVST
jgi:hypothetical protein